MKVATITIPTRRDGDVLEPAIARGYPLNVRLPSGVVLHLFLQDAHKQNNTEMVLTEYTTGMIFSRGLYGAHRARESEPDALKNAAAACVFHALQSFGETRILETIGRAPKLNAVPDFPVETVEV